MSIYPTIQCKSSVVVFKEHLEKDI